MGTWGILIYIAVLLSSCQSTLTHMNMDEMEVPLNAASVPAREPFTIVLVHGLEGAPENFYRIHKTLEKVYPEATIFPLHELDTVKQDIQSQAKKGSVELSMRIKENALQESPLVVIGHSQGGLRANEMLQQYGKTLTGGEKILITISTPWLGSPMLDQEEELSKAVTWLANSTVAKLMPVLKRVEGLKLHQSPGIKDLKPDSYFINRLHLSLRNNNLRPAHLNATDTLVIATSLDPESRARRFINWVGSFYGFDTTAYLEKMHGSDKHDLLAPVPSQLGEGVLKSDSDDRMVKERTVKGEIIHNTNMEGSYFTRRRLGLTGALEHDEVIKEVIDFINGKLHIEKEINEDDFYTPDLCAIL